MRTLARNGSPPHGTRPQAVHRANGLTAASFHGPGEDAREPPRYKALATFVLAVVAFLAIKLAHGADPQPYKVDMASTGNSEINATLKATSDLETLRTSAPVGPFGLIGRARSDLDRLKTVLESFGYYQSYVDIKIDGLALDDPELGEKLTGKPKGEDARVSIVFYLGDVYHLRNITLDGPVPDDAKGALGLKTGELAVAATVLAAGEKLQTALEDEGYAFAKVDQPIAQEIPDDRVLDVSFHVVTGAQVHIGDIQIKGLKRMREKFVLQRLMLHKGELYGASKVERARKDLLALGVFTAVTVQLGAKPDSEGQIPVTFKVRERPLHSVSLAAAYSTDLGGSSTVSWTHRDVSGWADQLTLSAAVLNLGGTASNGIGYDLGAKYLLPEFLHRDQSLQLAVQAINQDLAAYDQRAITFGATLNRKLSRLWTVSIGLTAEVEKIGQEGYFNRTCPATGCPDLTAAELLIAGPDPTADGGLEEEIFTTDELVSHYTLLGIPLNILYNSTGLDSPIEDPTHGMRISLTETPTISLGTNNAKFFITQGSASYYLDLQNFGWSHDPGRSVIAVKALAGLAQGAGEYSLPPDQRFYAGGAGTVRGYRYQSVGPLFPDHNPIGGTAINAGTIEYRQRIGKSLGFAVFLDGGQVSQNVNPLDSTLRFGTGAGARYYTPIGPLRLDLGVPINKLPGGDAFEIYIGLGQSF